MYSQINANKRRTALLIVVFVMFILGVGWAFSEFSEMGPAGIVLAAIVAVAMSLVSFYSGDKVALFAAGAHRVERKEDNPYVWRLVENLAITAGLPLPAVYLVADPAPNAFATGRDPAHASVALTTGLISSLENEELEGVIAHELGHIKNFDTRLMMVVIVLVGIVTLLANWFFRISLWGGRGNRRSGGNAGALLALVGLVLLILSPIIAELIKLAVSRRREFLADASGALLTRYPEGLARALEKIAGSSAPLARANSATAHLWFASPFGPKHGGMVKLFSTHPPIEERVAALRTMA